MPTRKQVSTSLMMECFRRDLTPGVASAFVREERQGRRDEYEQRDMMLAAYDSLVSGGFVSRSDVYFSAPALARDCVAAIAADRGQSWAPGERSGLHKAMRDLHPELDPLDVEVCIRFGPLESLLGDLFANLRRYELLLWGFVVGVMANHYGDADDGDWRETLWWRLGTPETDRKRLTSEWGERPDIDRPWRLATFGSMEKMIDKNKALLARAGRDKDARSLGAEVGKVARIRNSVMHPLSERMPTEGDFAFVTEALGNLVARVANGSASSQLKVMYLPPLAGLMMPRILDEQLSATVAMP